MSSPYFRFVEGSKWWDKDEFVDTSAGSLKAGTVFVGEIFNHFDRKSIDGSGLGTFMVVNFNGLQECVNLLTGLRLVGMPYVRIHRNIKPSLELNV